MFYSIKNCIFVSEKMVNYTKMKAKQNKQSFPFVALFSVTKENNSATTEFVGATRNLNALFFTEEFFESYPLIYRDEFGRVVGVTTEPELKGVEVTPYQEISIYNQMGEFVAFLSELEGEKKGVLEYDPVASCYWKPIDDLSQEELTLFLGAKNCAEKNSILKRFARKLYSPELIDLLLPYNKAAECASGGDLTTSPERAAEILINFGCIEDAIFADALDYAEEGEGYYFNGAYFKVAEELKGEEEGKVVIMLPIGHLTGEGGYN